MTLDPIRPGPINSVRFSNYTGWMVADPDTECPDCQRPLEGFSGDLDQLLTAIDDHQRVCEGVDLP